MSNNLECGMSKDTELLTPNGWISIQHVTTKIPVLQYSEDGYMSFAKPLGVRKTPVDKAILISCKAKRVKQIVHPMTAIPITNPKKWLKVYRASNLPSQRMIINVGNMRDGNIGELSCLEKVKIAFTILGKTVYKGKKGDICEFTANNVNHFNKLTSLFTEANIHYTVNYRGGGNNRVLITHCASNAYGKDFEWINYGSISGEWCRNFIKELFILHGFCSKSHLNNLCYRVNNPHILDTVQTVSTLAGYRTTVGTLLIRGKYPYNEIGISMGRKGTWLSRIEKEVIDYDDDMYTVVMPTNMVVTRLHRAISVIGCYGVNKPRGLTINREFRQ